MRHFASALVVGLLCVVAPGVAAQESGVSLDQPLPLPILRKVTEIAVFNADTGSVRWLKVLRDVEPEQTANRLSRFLDRPVEAGALRVVRDAGDQLSCNCLPLLQPGEYLVSEEPIRDVSGRYVSVNDESFKAITELLDYPLNEPALTGVMLSELTYVNNDDAVRRFLSARGFDVVLTYGFLNAERRESTLTLPVIVARHDATGAGYIGVRGTAEVGDLRTNLQATLVPWAENAGLVHKGFFDAANETVRIAGDALGEMHATAPQMPIYAVGHSLGAAVTAMLTVRLADDIPTLRAFGFAPPPIGNRAFAEAVRAHAAHVTNFFVPHEEIRTLGDLSQISKLQWLGAETLLDDMGATASRYHYVINYLKGVLKANGGSVKDYEQSLPVCVLHKTPCFAGWRENVVPLCVLDDPTCIETRWPEMRAWLMGGEAERTTARTDLAALKLRVLRADPPPYLMPLLFASMARLAASAGLSAEALGYLANAERGTGPRRLYEVMRTRIGAPDG
jgi:pimeloyl-ACP methyl ester carboxylesterase